MFYIFNLKKVKKKLILFIIFIFFIYFINSIIKILFPLNYYDTIKKYSTLYNIDNNIIVSIINTESKFKKNAVSYAGAMGLMQIRKKTADSVAKELNIKDYNYNKIFEPDINIQIGTWYIKNLLVKYNNNLDLALASYNAGTGTISKWLKNYDYSLDGKNLYNIPYKETKNYIKKVKLNMKIYKIILWRKECIKKLLYL